MSSHYLSHLITPIIVELNIVHPRHIVIYVRPYILKFYMPYAPLVGRHKRSC